MVEKARVHDERVPALLDELRALGSEAHRAAMLRFAIKVENAFGVSIYALRKVAKRLGREHDLALALWATGNHEARLLACFVDDPEAVTEEQTEAWARDFDSWDICDQATTSLFDLSKYGWAKARAWATREEEWVKRGGFALMAGLAVHDRGAEDEHFLELLPLLEQAAFDDRHFVKKAVNWALRNIGKRNLALNAAALACAFRLRQSAKNRPLVQGRADSGARSALWIASDAIRELSSAKVQARLAARLQPRPRRQNAKPQMAESLADASTDSASELSETAQTQRSISKPVNKSSTPNKTQASVASVEAFLDAIADPQQQRDAKALDALFRGLSGHAPKMWGPSIVGYGVYHYRYPSGREGDSFRLGFSPRKQNMSVYLMSGFEDLAPLLEKLGKYKLGKSCLYVKRLSEVDLGTLTELARRAWDEMQRRYPE